MKKRTQQVLRRTTSGIVLRCTDTVSAFAPDGTEIISRYWGNTRTTLSQHKVIVREIATHHKEKKEVTRKELTRLLHQQSKSMNGVHVDEERLRDRLSTLLSQIKKTFSPYPLFEKTEYGYRLHASVRVEIIEAKSVNQYSNFFYNHNIFSL